MDRLRKLLAKFDWHYENSDDPRVWNAGIVASRELREAIKECFAVDPEGTRELIDEFCPMELLSSYKP